MGSAPGHAKRSRPARKPRIASFTSSGFSSPSQWPPPGSTTVPARCASTSGSAGSRARSVSCPDPRRRSRRGRLDPQALERREQLPVPIEVAVPRQPAGEPRPRSAGTLPDAPYSRRRNVARELGVDGVGRLKLQLVVSSPSAPRSASVGRTRDRRAGGTLIPTTPRTDRAAAARCSTPPARPSRSVTAATASAERGRASRSRRTIRGSRTKPTWDLEDPRSTLRRFASRARSCAT
jgi:hypothetical protein